MGFFSKIKNSMTGGWAKLNLFCEGGERGEEMPLSIEIAVKDESINVDEIYVILECREVIDIPNYRANDRDQPGDVDYLHIHHATELLRHRFSVAPPQTLEANSTQTLECVIPVPENLPPTYRGPHARVEWRLFAGLDMKGNDPDSGWREILVE